jgi:hypothetical protein
MRSLVSGSRVAVVCDVGKCHAHSGCLPIAGVATLVDQEERADESRETLGGQRQPSLWAEPELPTHSSTSNMMRPSWRVDGNQGLAGPPHPHGISHIIVN